MWLTDWHMMEKRSVGVDMFEQHLQDKNTLNSIPLFLNFDANVIFYLHHYLLVIQIWCIVFLNVLSFSTWLVTFSDILLSTFNSWLFRLCSQFCVYCQCSSKKCLIFTMTCACVVESTLTAGTVGYIRRIPTKMDLQLTQQ